MQHIIAIVSVHIVVQGKVGLRGHCTRLLIFSQNTHKSCV
jgi:hypothetical protein